MSKKKSVKLNYIFNLLYQIFLIAVPLITTPYISRVLGSSGVGQYSFTLSIASYFMLFAGLGFGYYAQREIARLQDDPEGKSKVFWEIVICKTVSTLLALGVYAILLFAGAYDSSYTTLLLILFMNVSSVIFDISFLYQGNEEFGLLTIKNVSVKLIGVLLIFIFVKRPDQVWVYALIQSVSLVLSNLAMWVGLFKRIKKVKPSELKVTRHIKPTLRLFIPTLAVSVYMVLDKTLIGFLVPGEVTTTLDDGTTVVARVADLENGYYEQSEKIVKMAMTIVTSLGTVMIPRNSKEIADGHMETFVLNVHKAIRFVFFLGTPIMLGMVAIAQNFAPWFFGAGFEKAPYLIMILSPLIMLIGLNNVVGLQYLIPLKEDTKFTICVCIGAGVNLTLNLCMIPFLYSYGAAIATIIAETVVTTMTFVFARKDMDFKSIAKTAWKYLLAGAIMFGATFVTQMFLPSSILNTFIIVGEGMVIYVGLLFLFRDDFLINLTQKALRKVFRKKAVAAETTGEEEPAQIEENNENPDEAPEQPSEEDPKE
ncbi:MAG: flippase [Bacilli bacterium]|nr:flippase [Bacilli bacterium]